jgi:hypothetical protein
VKHRRTGLSFGFTPILVISQFSTVRARNIDSSEDLVDSQGNPKEGRAYYTGSGLAFSGIFGVRWEHPTKPGWAAAFTYQRGARLKIEGDLELAFGTTAPTRQHAFLEMPIADTIRLGGSIRATRWLTLRPMLEINLWSTLQEHKFTSAKDGTPLVLITRRSSDVYAGHLRADFQLHPRWRLMLSFGGENGATPSSTMEPGFGENHNLTAGIGALVALSHYVDLSATFMYQHFLTYRVFDSIQQPLTNGTYTDNREFVLIHLEVHEWR